MLLPKEYFPLVGSVLLFPACSLVVLTVHVSLLSNISTVIKLEELVLVSTL